MSTPPPADLPSRTDDVAPFLARHLPDLVGAPVRFLGAGWDNACYLVDDHVVVRASTQDDGPRAVAEETTVLALVGGRVPCRLPTPLAVDVDAAIFAYELVPGEPATTLSVAGATALGETLAELHAIPLDLAAVPRRDRTPSVQLDEARARYRACRGALPADVRTRIETFLGAEPPPAGTREALCHNDLAAEHVIIDDDGGLVGIIDWADARITDPTADFAGLYRDLGQQACDQVMDAYWRAGGTVEAGDLERVRFSARCAVVLDLEYAVKTGRSWDDAMRALPHTLG